MFRWHVVSAVFLRNLKQYFTSPLGYLFIIVFVTLCSVLTFSPQFFADNLANLDQLSRYYPLLLLFIIPAITMSIWAEEKRSGTDAILFTLPASDFEIVLGKYLSVVAVYTIALVFSTAQLWFLNKMGAPDWGMIATTYFGYWLAGCALLSVGMFASSLTRSATIAFVLGAVFCAVPVLMGEYFRGSSLLESVDSVASNLETGALNEVVSETPAPGEGEAEEQVSNSGLADNENLSWLNVPLEKLGISWNLQDFAVGLIPFTNVIYFLSITVFMFYLNMVVISSRHWSGDRNLGMKGHFLVRTLALVVAFVAVNYLVSAVSTYVPSRFDFTNEKLYSLSQTTIDTMAEAREKDRQVTIQAFVSSEVPREYADVKKQFVSTLRQFDLLGGNLVDLRLVNVEPFSEHEAEARQLGITPRTVESETGSKTVEQEVFMGALISSPIDDAVLPFIDSDTSVEYELSRAIAATTSEEFKITVGIVESDVHFAGPEIEGTRITQWPVYQTANRLLERQYDVTNYKMSQLGDFLPEENPPATEGEDAPENLETEPELVAPDVMLVPFPSCFDTTSMEALVKYIEAGHSVLILDDPLTFFWTYQDPTGLAVFHAPNIPRVQPDNPYHDYIAGSFFPKDDEGRAGKLLSALGIDWQNGTAVWSVDNPHPNFGGAFPQYRQEQLRAYLGPYDKAFVWTREVDESPIEIREILRYVREKLLSQMPEDERARFEAEY
ncbi:MAG: Gldg family protein, partial [Planctomycetota bacterium]